MGHGQALGCPSLIGGSRPVFSRRPAPSHAAAVLLLSPERCARAACPVSGPALRGGAGRAEPCTGWLRLAQVAALASKLVQRLGTGPFLPKGTSTAAAVCCRRHGAAQRGKAFNVSSSWLISVSFRAGEGRLKSARAQLAVSRHSWSGQRGLIWEELSLRRGHPRSWFSSRKSSRAGRGAEASACRA